MFHVVYIVWISSIVNKLPSRGCPPEWSV
jgi:hypothetical protein